MMFGKRKRKGAVDTLDDLIERNTRYWRNLFAKEADDARRTREEYAKRKKAMEAEIRARILENMPDLHFRACPFCGQEPTINVYLYPVTFVNRIEYDVPFKGYRVEMVTCEHLNATGHFINDYNADEIPDKPLYRNPDRRWDDWNDSDVPFEALPLTFDSEKYYRDPKGKVWLGKDGKYYSTHIGWARSVGTYLEYLSDDWEDKCAKCGKKWRGYESFGDAVIVDGLRVCSDCADIWEDRDAERPRARLNVIRDGLDIDSMYLQDNPWEYYTTLDACLKSHGITEDGAYTVHVAENRSQGSDALTGSISGDHWEIWKKNTDPNLSERSHWNLMGYVFNPDNVAEYERLERKG